MLVSLKDFISKQFLDIIQWEDQTQDTILYKFPMQDNEIQNNGKLIVRPGQAAIFVNEGIIADIFTEPNTYTLNTQTLPVIGDLKGWAYGFQSPFKADVYFINTKQLLDQKWGTSTPILIPDPKFEQVEIKAFGTFSFRITEPRQFLVEVTSTNRSYITEQIRDQLRSFIISNFVPVIVQQKVTVADLAANYKLIDQVMTDSVAAEFKNLGLTMTTFQILSITPQEEYLEMMRKRSGVNIMGGMQNYAQVETLEAMKESVQSPGVNAMNQAGIGLGIGLGWAMSSPKITRGRCRINSSHPPSNKLRPHKQRPRRCLKPARRNVQVVTPTSRLTLFSAASAGPK